MPESVDKGKILLTDLSVHRICFLIERQEVVRAAYTPGSMKVERTCSGKERDRDSYLVESLKLSKIFTGKTSHANRGAVHHGIGAKVLPARVVNSPITSNPEVTELHVPPWSPSA